MYSVKQTHQQNEVDLTLEQIIFIQEYRLPSVMEITQASEFDTPYVQTKADIWEFVRLGKTHKHYFNLGEHTNKLLKILYVKHTESHMSPLGDSFYPVRAFLKNSKELSFSYLLKVLESEAKTNKSRPYYEIKSAAKYLIRMGFPGFEIDDEETLLRLETPNVSDPFLRYQEVEDTLPTHLKSLIAKRLVEFGTKEGLASLSNVELRNLCVLGLSFAIGPRPQQFAMLKGSSVKIKAANHRTNLKRYQVAVPLAKQPTVPVDEPRVALSQEIGGLIDEYKQRLHIDDDDALFMYDAKKSKALSHDIYWALNDALLFIQSDKTKDKIKRNEMHRPLYTAYDFRHNIGHSMAMAGCGAEEISMVLGQTTTVAAQYYIMSTPELALLKHQAIGQNPIWKDMVGLLLTGYFTNESEWTGKTVSGMLRGRLIHRLGGCARQQDKCHLAIVRSCYGCFYFRPFKNLQKHQLVHEIISHEMFVLVKASHHAGQRNNPLIDDATQSKNEVEMVINRLKGGLR
ncbi:hypothetical protein J4H63_19410 [Vibrio alginolyticus]|uniref:hypothetical protein n=1 Tax=Vibrio harveyi group TaxID=717610 RepID=UPI001BD1D01C|nr:MULTISPECIES: hypothetical protein [Vibrio harveyi group]MBS9971574.1 hypothetical protein [Vibrio alginolyticus]MDA0382516.1 hypothetical protein [Vibrio owensii]